MKKISIAIIIVAGFIALSHAQQFDFVTVINGKVVDVSSAPAIRMVFDLPGTALKVGDTYKVPASTATAQQTDGTMTVK